MKPPMEILQEKLSVACEKECTCKENYKCNSCKVIDRIEKAIAELCEYCEGTGQILENAGMCGSCDVCGSNEEHEEQCPHCDGGIKKR